MIKIEHVEVFGWEAAIRGMRNPMNSWEKMDSDYDDDIPGLYRIGEADNELMMKLANGGPVHAKYRRMIDVYMDITAPLYWWKEFDTYKVGTVANSCSTMHKIHEKEFVPTDFSWEKLNERSWSIFKATIDELNYNREKYLECAENLKSLKVGTATKERQKQYWDQMIQLLPSSYNQLRTVKMNYEVLANIYKWRKDHKLSEWREFCEIIEKLPYSEIFTGEVNKNG